MDSMPGPSSGSNFYMLPLPITCQDGNGNVQLQPAAQRVASRAVGKTGAQWDDESTLALLKYCRPHKRALRVLRVDKNVWAKISDLLFENHQMDYSPEMCKEKIRNLKRGFKDFKDGKQKTFVGFDLMVEIYDLPLDQEESQPPFGTVCFQGQSQGNLSGGCENSQVLNQCQIPQESSTLTVEASFLEAGCSTSFAGNEFSHCIEAIQAAKVVASDHDPPLGDPGLLADYEILSLDSEDFSTLPVHGNDSEVVYNFSQHVASNPQQAGEQKGTGVVQSTSVTRNKKTGTGSSGAGSWDKKMTTAAVEKFLIYKNEVQQCEGCPMRVFKDISDELKAQGFTTTPGACRDKFLQMNEFFVSVLPSGGVRSGFQWPYYSEFCSIHDLPIDFILPDNFQPVLSYETPAGNQIWTEPAVCLLLSEYKARKQLFDSTKSPIRHQVLFTEIASTMRNFLIPVSVKQCSDHLSTLKMKFMEEFDRLNVRNTGQPPTTWVYYEKMLDIFSGSPNLHTPFLVSAGKGLLYSIQGKQQASSSSGTRTRPSEPKPTNTPKKPMTAQQYKEKLIDQRYTLNDEIKNLRETFERTSAARSSQLQQLREILHRAVEK